MLVILHNRLGAQPLADGFGSPRNTVDAWMAGRAGMSDSTRKMIWLVYSLIFRPCNLATWFDIVTWGKFARDLSTRPEDMPDAWAGHRRRGKAFKRTAKGKFKPKRKRGQRVT